MDNITWLVVANSAKAQIFKAHKATLFNGDASKLSLVSEHEHPESRKLDGELVTDKQGHFGSGTFVESTDPKKHEEEVFAMELAKRISKGHGENQFHELIFIAPPAFMGMLNKHLPSDINKLVQITIEKDYTRCNERELVQHLQGYL